MVIVEKKLPGLHGPPMHHLPLFLIDETGMWLLYNEPYLTRLLVHSSNTHVLQLLDPHDFTMLYQMTFPRIARRSAIVGWLMLCGKLYSLTTDTVHVYDINNDRDTFSYVAKIDEGFKQHLMYTPVHYNPRLEQLFANTFGTYFRYNLTSCNSPSDESRLSLVTVFQKWTVQPNYNSELIKMVGELERYTNEQNIFAQVYAANQISRCPAEICQDPNHASSLYCRIKSCATHLKILTDYKQSVVVRRKILQTEFHMHRILEQTTLRTLSLQIAELRHFMDTKFDNLTDEFTDQVDRLTDDLTDQVDRLTDIVTSQLDDLRDELRVRLDDLTDEMRDNFEKLTAEVSKFKGQLGSYFQTLALYDQKRQRLI